MRSSLIFSQFPWSCNVGSTWVPLECPWIGRKFRILSDEQGFKQWWNLFFSPPPFAKQFSQSSTVHCKVPTNITLNSSIKSSNRTAPSSSRGIDGSCRSNLIIAFDKAKQFGRKLRIDVCRNSFTNRNAVGRQIHNKFRSCLSFCNKSPCAYEQLNVLNGNFFWRFCDVFFDPIHSANPWNCLVLQWFDNDSNTTTTFVKMEFHIQDWADLRIWTNPPFRSGCCDVSRMSVFSTCCLHILRSFLNCDGELSFPNFLRRNQRRCIVSTISDHQEVLRISVRILASKFPCANDELWDVASASALSVGITKDTQITLSAWSGLNSLHKSSTAP